ncbi:MAG: hypothetical protein IPK00_13620 [Deltaproteobacteria bacterium]|nr:hypothetical protein [Deltaproteobacteria bacterium]
MGRRLSSGSWVAAWVVAGCWAGASALEQAADPAQAPPERVDYLTFARGTVPVRVSEAATANGVTIEKSLLAIDGNPAGYTLSMKFVPATAEAEFTYRLPALTTFDRFAVPNVLETPSAGSTFTRLVEVRLAVRSRHRIRAAGIGDAHHARRRAAC